MPAPHAPEPSASSPPSARASPPGGARIPSLDGLRALAITLVLVSHLASKGAASRLAAVGDLGNLGVRIFFVISGFLITSLLVDEHRRAGRISLPRFYLRRTFRIFPAYYAMLAATALAAHFEVIALAPGDLLHAITYTTNLHHARSWWLGHTWSLAVEEQFYLLWPAALALVGLRRAPWIAGAVIVAAPLARVAVWFLWPPLRVGISEAFPTVADALAAGCLLAFVRDGLWARPAFQRALRSPLAGAALLAVIVGANRMSPYPRYDLLAGQTVLNLTIALLVERCVRTPESLSGRVLAARPLTLVGLGSYSLYLWQQPFARKAGEGWIRVVPFNLLIVTALALASYHLLEKPFLRWRRRIERRFENG